jgi:hypothetical protein
MASMVAVGAAEVNAAVLVDGVHEMLLMRASSLNVGFVGLTVAVMYSELH